MSSIQLKEEILKHIEATQDEKFLQIVLAMMEMHAAQQEEDPIIGYDVEGNPQYASEKKEQFRKDIAAAKGGKSFTVKELRNDKRWLKDTE